MWHKINIERCCTTFNIENFIKNPSIIKFISKGEISNLDDPQMRTNVKGKLMEFMAETTQKLIS